jgi:hypothetical protein
MEKLNSRRRVMGPIKFANQLMNETLDSESQVFYGRWFRLIPMHQVPHRRLLRVYVFTDYAFGQDERNDRSVIWVVGLDYERIAYVLDLDAGRWGWAETNTRIMDYTQKWDAEKIAVEYVTSNEGALEFLKSEIRKRRMKCKVVPIPGRSTESKHARIQSMQARFEDERIYFVERTDDMFGVESQYLDISDTGRKIGQIIDEFTRFPKHPHDDLPDALSDIDKLDKKTSSYLFPGAAGRMTGYAGPDRPMQVDRRIIGPGLSGKLNPNSRRGGALDQSSFWSNAARGSW